MIDSYPYWLPLNPTNNKKNRKISKKNQFFYHLNFEAKMIDLGLKMIFGLYKHKKKISEVYYFFEIKCKKK